ncbi:hypothetical protein BGX38DRAFT_866496 [Terfezia claveryi]|nr:hypothetical protein BGX38DRAFT_866496 [Terfezia claveryi]
MVGLCEFAMIAFIYISCLSGNWRLSFREIWLTGMQSLALREIRSLDIDTSRLGIGIGKRIYGNGYRSGVWKATVERLVRASYGPQACLEAVIRAARRKKPEEDEAARKEYRRKMHLLTFNYIKILWQCLGAVNTLSNSDTSHVQALDGIRNLEEISWLPSNENLMGDVKLWLPIASHFPASNLKVVWFLLTTDSNFYQIYNSASGKPTCNNNNIGMGRSWMRCIMKWEPKSDWLALAAWTITRSVIARVKEFVPPVKGRTGYGVDEMRLAFGNSFRRKWEILGAPLIIVIHLKRNYIYGGRGKRHLAQGRVEEYTYR